MKKQFGSVVEKARPVAGVRARGPILNGFDGRMTGDVPKVQLLHMPNTMESSCTRPADAYNTPFMTSVSAILGKKGVQIFVRPFDLL